MRGDGSVAGRAGGGGLFGQLYVGRHCRPGRDSGPAGAGTTTHSHGGWNVRWAVAAISAITVAMSNTGSGSVTLPSGSIYWVLASRNEVEGCYGLDSDGVERPSSGSVPQAANRNCQTCVAP